MIHDFPDFLTKLIIVPSSSKNMAESIPISQAKQMRSGVNVEAEIIEKPDARTVNLKAGGTVEVCDAIIANEDNPNIFCQPPMSAFLKVTILLRTQILSYQ